MAPVASTLTLSAAETLAEFCVSLCWDEFAEAVKARTRELLLDLIGVALVGSRQASSEAATEAALRLGGGSGNANVIGTRHATTAVWAALANGTAAHAVELDDVTTESSLHPGVAVIPAALALAQELEAPPKALPESIVAGYEVTMRVGNALNPASAYARGFHPTGVAGIFGATMAASHLLRLGAQQRTAALGIAGTLAAGSLEYLADGAWTKRLNPGWAGHAGITAASLARAGFSGPRSVFEGRLGLLHAYSDAALPVRLLADLGQPLQVMRVSIKPYACCRYNHGLIDCVLRLASSEAVAPAEVERIRLGVLSGGALLVAEPIEQMRCPRSVVDAQFSAPYAAAVALGANLLEKHFTLDRTSPGPDHPFAIEPGELKELVAPVRRTSGQNRDTENLRVIAAAPPTISGPTTQTEMALKWNSGSGVSTTSSARRCHARAICSARETR